MDWAAEDDDRVRADAVVVLEQVHAPRQAYSDGLAIQVLYLEAEVGLASKDLGDKKM